MYLERDGGHPYPETVIRSELPDNHFIRICATGRDIEKFAFYELYFTDDEDELFKLWQNNQTLPELRDYSAFGINPSEADEICERKDNSLVNLWQKKRLVVSEQHLRRKDMIHTDSPSHPKLDCHVFLVSKRFKEAAEKEQFTGFRFEPCLLLGKTYDKNSMTFASNVKENIEFADIFQLVITNLTNAPCLVGPNERVDDQQSFRFEAPYDYKMPTNHYFKPDDLLNLDMQIDIGSTMPIFSSRFYQFFIKNKFKGLQKSGLKKSAFTPCVVVPIRMNAYDDSIHDGHWDVDTINEYLLNQ